MRKVLVTGASGMLGANLCRRLVESGQEVKALTRGAPPHPLLQGIGLEECLGDLSDLDSLRRAAAGCDRVYHAAGLISYRCKDRRRLYEVNVTGTRNLLQAARDAGVGRVVTTSSTAAVGIPRSCHAPLDETAPFSPRYRAIPYMDSKRAAEKLALAFPGIEVVAVNPATIYGAGDVRLNTGVVFQRIKEGRLMFCPPGGTAVVGVKDCVEGHLLAMERGRPGRRYILASGNHSFADLFGRIARVLGVRPPPLTLPRTLYPLACGAACFADLLGLFLGDLGLSRPLITIAFQCRYFSAQRARAELGWSPSQDVDDVLAEAAAFYFRYGLLEGDEQTATAASR